MDKNELKTNNTYQQEIEVHSAAYHPALTLVMEEQQTVMIIDLLHVNVP